MNHKSIFAFAVFALFLASCNNEIAQSFNEKASAVDEVTWNQFFDYKSLCSRMNFRFVVDLEEEGKKYHFTTSLDNGLLMETDSDGFITYDSFTTVGNNGYVNYIYYVDEWQNNHYAKHETIGYSAEGRLFDRYLACVPFSEVTFNSNTNAYVNKGAIKHTFRDWETASDYETTITYTSFVAYFVDGKLSSYEAVRNSGGPTNKIKVEFSDFDETSVEIPAVRI